MEKTSLSWKEDDDLKVFFLVSGSGSLLGIAFPKGKEHGKL
ncbi:MAG: hypothetical protein ACI9GM_000921 [Salibacteraceae bacterium]